MIGPMIGGLLANPAKHHPNLFKNLFGGLFVEYPYLLPCLASATISAIGFFLGIFFMPETNTKRGRYERIDDEASFSEPQVQKPVSKSISTGALWMSLTYAILAFQNLFWSQLFPLWAVSTPGVGLGFHGGDIGTTMSSIGICNLLSLVVLYPYVSKQVSPLFLLRVPAILLQFFYISTPLLSTFIAPSKNLSFLVQPLLILLYGFRSLIISTAMCSCMILVNASAGDGQLGFVNGLAQASASLTRFIAPLIAGPIWAWSLQKGHIFPLNHYLVFLILSTCNLIMVGYSWTFLKEEMFEENYDEVSDPLLRNS
jgi:hypothetical protein